MNTEEIIDYLSGHVHCPYIDEWQLEDSVWNNLTFVQHDYTNPSGSNLGLVCYYKNKVDGKYFSIHSLVTKENGYELLDVQEVFLIREVSMSIFAHFKPKTV